MDLAVGRCGKELPEVPVVLGGGADLDLEVGRCGEELPEVFVLGG